MPHSSMIQLADSNLILVLVSCLLATTTTATVATSAEDNSKQVDQYTSEMIRNDKIRDVYVKCMLDQGPCSHEAADVKKMIPEAVQKGCQKCSEVQKKIIEKMMLYLKEKQPEVLNQVTLKFDPKGEFMKTFLTKLHVKNQASNESGQQQSSQPIRN